ncbi:ATP-binding protein [Cupriavidus neocaledonicus]|uniref:Virulence sensor protein BvgS n=1 Tax=Cupriavidus neocaledonicus TaxID=1040979 RepID=A0A375HME8_9BURK|nr:ATP-binding protein [Cupriavidus neocaledonicus]SOZ38949.1 Sensor protein rcsC [Cupriavidus neocaledonicus]SPD59408.1 Two-component system, NarL family, capsular synthesis sensor histidine kinase RcsC [Cupriavidus neocaledonicus]
MQQDPDRARDTLASTFDALADHARRQQHLYSVTIAALLAIVLCSGTLLAWLAADQHLDYRRSQVAHYVGTVSQRLHNEVSFVRRTALSIRYHLRAAVATPSRDPEVEALRRTGAAGVHVEAVRKDYHLLAADATRRAWGAGLPTEFARLRQIALAAVATQQAFDLDHGAYAVSLDEDSAVVIRQPEAGARAPLALDAALIPRLRAQLTRALLERTGRAVPARDQPVWLGPLHDPVDDSPIMVLAGAAYAGDSPTMLVAACVPVQAFLAGLPPPQDHAGLALLNDADRLIDVWPHAGSLSSASARDIAARVGGLPHHALRLTRSGVVLVQPLQPGFGLLVYHLPYRLLGKALAAELAVIGAAMLLLTGAIVLAARYWSRHLLRRSHAEARRALESELMNQVLVSATPVGLCIVRQHDYAVLACNPLAASLLPARPHEALPAAVAAVLARQPGGAGGGPASVCSVTVAAPPAPGPADAAPRFLQVTYAPARYRDEAVLFCAVLDCTAQEALQQQLRSAQQAAEAMLRVRSTFFAAMSHEIRTPLNALLGNLELLARSGGMEPHAARLRALETAAGSLRRIVNDVLDFSKIDAGQLALVNAPFRPVEALESLALAYAPMVAGRPLRFCLQLSPTLATEVVGDRTRLVQVFNNLLNNAFKFTASGRITLRGELQADARGMQRLVCSVSDSGIGMAPALAARVFQPFVQGDAAAASRYGGTGLGLSICARLCELMGGSIVVNSVPEVGSAFTVSVPLAPGDSGRPAPAAAGLTHSGHVLVLSPEERTGASIEAWLKTAGWHTEAVASIAAAQASVQRTAPAAVVASEDFAPAALAALRQAAPLALVWLTADGPHRPRQRGPGMLEASAFSHRALLDAVAAATGATQPATRPMPAPATPALPAPALAPLTILVAEDNPLNQSLVAEQLQAIGCHPIVTGNGRQALAVLERTRVDALLTDLHMPEMDGHALLHAVRAKYPHLPVMAFSAVACSDPEHDRRLRGFSGYLAKPASLQDLNACLRGLRGRPRAASDAGAGAPPRDAATTAEAPRRRYEDMLRRQLQQDLPALARILAQQDLSALRHWVHATAGAFMIVRRQSIVSECRELEALCEAAPAWAPAMADAADTLYKRLQRYALGAAAGT